MHCDLLALGRERAGLCASCAFVCLFCTCLCLSFSFSVSCQVLTALLNVALPELFYLLFPYSLSSLNVPVPSTFVVLAKL